MESRWDDAEAARFRERYSAGGRRSRAARLHVAPDRRGARPGAARRRQHVGEGARARPVRARDRRAAREGLAVGTSRRSSPRDCRRCGSSRCSRCARSTRSPTRTWSRSSAARCSIRRRPTPSIETLLHAFLPAKFVDHSHADAILALTNQPDGEARVRALFGERVGWVPYMMPGFALAKRAAEVFEKDPTVRGARAREARALHVRRRREDELRAARRAGRARGAYFAEQTEGPAPARRAPGGGDARVEGDRVGRARRARRAHAAISIGRTAASCSSTAAPTDPALRRAPSRAPSSRRPRRSRPTT